MKKAFACSVVLATMLTTSVLACDYQTSTGTYQVVNNYNTTNIYNNYGGTMNVYSNSGSGYQEASATYVADTCGLCGQTWDVCTCYDQEEESCGNNSGYNTDCISGCVSSGTDYNVCTANNVCLENSEWRDLTGITYYDAYGHLCSYGGYWEGGQWITTCGYYENGIWYPAEYDPALEVGYYDAYGNYYSYYGSTCSTQSLCRQVYDETTTWACDAYPGETAECGYYEATDYDCTDYSDCYIDVDLSSDTISVVNNGVIIITGTCTVNNRYEGQEFCFDDQKCSGIWWQCSDGFYDQACQYMSNDSKVCCH